MMYTEEHITTPTSYLSYRHYTGPDSWLVLFHGFGQSSEHFHELCIALQPHYSILSVDLFFHGASTYTNARKDAIEIDEWSAILNTLLQTHSIKRFSILGFSIGGRFAVSSLAAFSNRMDQLILIAPDGIVMNPWYVLATSTLIARTIFKQVVLHPQFFLTISKLLTYLRLTDDRVVKFAQSQMQSLAQRNQVYNSWVYFRKLRMKTSLFLNYAVSDSIHIKMILGTKDRIVRKNSFDSILKHPLVTIKEIPFTHSKIVYALSDVEVLAFIRL